jgi:hypothetical protein
LLLEGHPELFQYQGRGGEHPPVATAAPGTPRPARGRWSPKAPRRERCPDQLVTPAVECSPWQGHVWARRQTTRSATCAHHRGAASRQRECPQRPVYNNVEGAQKQVHQGTKAWRWRSAVLKFRVFTEKARRQRHAMSHTRSPRRCCQRTLRTTSDRLGAAACCDRP